MIKDGPSAGVAFIVALVSLFSDQPVPATLAMTGEVSLRGRVTAVGMSPFSLPHVAVVSFLPPTSPSIRLT